MADKYEQEIQKLFNNLHTEFQAIPRDNKYKDLCNSIVYIVRRNHQKNPALQPIHRDKLKTNFNSSLKLLLLGLCLVFNGREDSIFNFVIDLEFNKMLLQNPNMSEDELTELSLTKSFISYFRKNDMDSIYSLISYISKDRQEFVPNSLDINWFEMPPV